jgi:putative transposase
MPLLASSGRANCAPGSTRRVLARAFLFDPVSKSVYITRKLKLGQSDQLDALAEASGDLWSRISASFWRTVRKKGIWLSKHAMQRWEVNGNPDLHSHSAQAVNDQFYEALASWRSNRENNPDSRPPHKQKRFNKIVWKSQAIRVKDGRLRLSNGRGNDPVWIRWQWPKPVRVEIGWDGSEYELRCQYKVKQHSKPKGNKVAGIDLGEIHLAVACDGKMAIIANGRELRAKRQYQNKLKAKLNAKIDRKERGSSRWWKLVRSKQKQLAKLRNQITDILHKQSTRLVAALHERGVATLVIGDVRGIRKRIDYGRKANQRLHQWAHAKFAHMLTYKARLYGMKVERVGESYTSQTCPSCENRKKPNGRNYHCHECGFEYHRDGVGALNIRKKYLRKRSAVVGQMACPSAPVGVKYRPHMLCSSDSTISKERAL